MAHLPIKKNHAKNYPDWSDNFKERQISSSILICSREINIVKCTLEYTKEFLYIQRAGTNKLKL